MPPKDVERMANRVDPDQSSLIKIYTVCTDIYVPIIRLFSVYVTKNDRVAYPESVPIHLNTLSWQDNGHFLI